MVFDPAKAAPTATGVMQKLTSVTRERLLTKLWRTVLGAAIGVALYLLDLDPGVEKWGWVLVGVLVASEWVFAPGKLLLALLRDAIPIVRELRAALKGQGPTPPEASP